MTARPDSVARPTREGKREASTVVGRDASTVGHAHAMSISQRLVGREARSVSQRLMSAPPVGVGRRIFLKDDQEEWIEARVVAQVNTLVSCVDDAGRQKELDLGFGELFPANAACSYEEQDMTSLEHLHLPAIYSHLKRRILDGKEYTSMGTMLVAVNPLEWREQPQMADLGGEPHPYAVAELAFARLQDPRSEAPSQSVVVSGESGAGKTETSKMLVAYLAWRGSSEQFNAGMLESLNPALESLGNAKTQRNDNSSRFGRLLQIGFNGALRLSSAKLKTYLLEKSRVCRHAQGETTFHALEHLGGSNRGSNDYLSGAAPSPSSTEGATAGLATIMSDASEVWQVLTAVMHLGSVIIVEEAEEARISCLEPVLEALGCSGEEAVLATLLESRELTSRGETFSKPRTQAEAKRCRDALARWLYSRTFDLVINRCNLALDDSKEEQRFVGILDVFGFESFAVNGFETLLINLANEALQQHFCECVFAQELALFVEEEIEFEAMPSPPDSTATLELITSKLPCGILALLDAQSLLTTGTDADFLASVHTLQVARTHPKQRREKFHVRHYAETVAYTVGAAASWREANVDALPDEAFSALLQRSTRAFVKNSFMLISKKKKRTVGGAFWSSMVDLRGLLQATDCSFIRCVKPTPRMIPGEVDGPAVCAQLRALGVVAACAVLKVALPTRLKYAEVLAKIPGGLLLLEEGEVTAVACALRAFGIGPELYRLGKTRVFFVASALTQVHDLLKATLDPSRLTEAVQEARRQRAVAVEAAVDVQSAVKKAAVARDSLAQFQRDPLALDGPSLLKSLEEHGLTMECVERGSKARLRAWGQMQSVETLLVEATSAAEKATRLAARLDIGLEEAARLATAHAGRVLAEAAEVEAALQEASECDVEFIQLRPQAQADIAHRKQEREEKKMEEEEEEEEETLADGDDRQQSLLPRGRDELAQSWELETLDAPALFFASEPDRPPSSSRPPAGWDAHWDSNYGLYYYFNKITGKTQWELPARPASTVTTTSLPGPAPKPPEDSEEPRLSLLASERKEGYLMKQGKWTASWKPRWFVLEDSYLEYYDKRRDSDGRAGSHQKNRHTMKLEPTSVTSFTEAENCFCIATGSITWFLVAQDEAEMSTWIAAINAHVLALREEAVDLVVKNCSPCFLRVLRTVEVRTHAALDASLNGQLLKPGDVVEVSRRLFVGGVEYARFADFGGWASSINKDFVPASGEWSSLGEKLRVLTTVKLRRGPSHAAQECGSVAVGQTVEAVAQFEADDGAAFVKLDGGWAPRIDPSTKRPHLEPAADRKPPARKFSLFRRSSTS